MNPRVHEYFTEHIAFCEDFYVLIEELTSKNLHMHVSIFNNSVTVHYYSLENIQHRPVLWFQYCGERNIVGDQFLFTENLSKDQMVYDVKELLKKYDA